MKTDPDRVPLGCSTCPNNKAALCEKDNISKVAKGYSLMFASALIVGLLIFQSVEGRYTKSEGFTFATKEIPITVALPGLLFLGRILGVDIDGLAQSIGGFISSGREL